MVPGGYINKGVLLSCSGQPTRMKLHMFTCNLICPVTESLEELIVNGHSTPVVVPFLETGVVRKEWLNVVVPGSGVGPIDLCDCHLGVPGCKN